MFFGLKSLTQNSRRWFSASASSSALYERVNVYFGSQTGTARMFASEFVKKVKADYKCDSDLIDLERYLFYFLFLF